MGEIVTNQPQMLAGNQRVLMAVGRVDLIIKALFCVLMPSLNLHVVSKVCANWLSSCPRWTIPLNNPNIHQGVVTLGENLYLCHLILAKVGGVSA